MKKITTLFLLIIISPILFSLSVSSANIIQTDEDGYEYYQETKFIDSDIRQETGIALSEDGRVFTWGKNENYMLGFSHSGAVSTPTDMTYRFNLNFDETITMISAGTNHMLAVTSDNRIFAWGTNYDGQLGTGNQTAKSAPYDISSGITFAPGETVEEISAGDSYSVLITSLGNVYTWGKNYYYQLGDGTNTMRTSPTDITSQFTLDVDEIIVSVEAGTKHVVALSNEGNVYTWGYNDYGQIGNGTFTTAATPINIMSMFTMEPAEEVIVVHAGFYHTVIGTSAGRVFSWGFNTYKTVGDNTTVNRSSPVDISASFSMGVDEVVESIGGMYHTILVTSEGRVFAWGHNNCGMIGDGTVTTRGLPIQTTNHFPEDPDKIIKVAGGWLNSMAISDSGNLYTWGDNDDGQVGDGYIGNSYDRRSPVLMPYDFDTLSISNILYENTSLLSSNFMHSILVTDNDELYAWGYNYNGQLGDDSSVNKKSPVNITSSFTFNALETITQVDTGLQHSIALTSDFRVFTWGDNTYGQLGNNTTNGSYLPIDITSHISLGVDDYIVSVYAGEYTNLLLSNDGVVYSFGRNNYGQIGNNSLVDQIIPLDITAYFNLGVDEEIEMLSIHTTHVLALSNADNVYSFGYNSHGQLGDNTLVMKKAPILIIEPGDLETDEVIIEINTGDRFSGALTNLGNIYMWGKNSAGQLGDGTYTLRRIPTNTMSNFALAIDETIAELNLGGSHVIVRTTDDRIFSFGQGTNGQLGTGFTTNLNSPYNITAKFSLEAGSNFDQFILGNHTSMLIADDGYLYCWGRNLIAELGFGDKAEYKLPTRLTKFSDELDVINLFDLKPKMDVSADFVKITLYPEYNIIQYLKSVTINSVEYLKVDLEITGGRIKILVPNTYSENDIITFTLNSIKLTDDTVVSVTGALSGETKFLIDSTPPTFDSIGNQVIEVLEYTDIDWTTYMDNVQDDFYEYTLIEVESTVNYTNLGLYTVTVKAIDESSNETSETFSVEVVDTTPAIVHYYGPTSFEVGTSELDLTYQIEGDDAYDGTLLGSYTDNILWDTVGAYHIEINIFDSSNNHSSQIVPIYIIDTTAPTFDTITDQIIEAGTTNIDWTTYITGELDNSLTYLSKVEFSDPIDYMTVGEYSVTVRLGDASFNYTYQTFTVEVVDTTAPTFDIIIDQIIEAGTADIDWTTYITGELDNSLTALTKVEYFDQIDYMSVGEYSINVRLYDELQNYSEQTFTVNIVDTTDPTFDLITDQIIEVMDYADIDWTTYIENALDNADGTLILTETDTVVYNAIGIYSVTVTVTDEEGNESSVTFSVSVVDTVDPNISLIGDEIIYVELGDEYVDLGTSFSDNSTEYDLSISGSVDDDTIGTYTLTYTVTDGADNTASVSRTIIVEDTLSPTVTLNNNIDTIYIDDVYTDSSVTYTDEDDSELVTVSLVDTSEAGEYLITYTVTDTSGNVTVVKRKVTVLEKEATVLFIINKGLTTINVGDTYEDKGCSAVVNSTSVACTISNNTVNSEVPGVYTVTYSVTVGTTTYSYDRYVFVHNEGTELILYYYKKEWELII